MKSSQKLWITMALCVGCGDNIAPPDAGTHGWDPGYTLPDPSTVDQGPDPEYPVDPMVDAGVITDAMTPDTTPACLKGQLVSESVPHVCYWPPGWLKKNPLPEPPQDDGPLL